MARRKRRKLNRKVVLVLAAAGVVLLAGVGGLMYRFRDRIWPKDPAACARRGDEELNAKHYKDAVDEYADAIRYSRNPREKAERYVRLADIYFQWAVGTAAEEVAQRRDRIGSFASCLETAKRVSPDYLDPRQRLASYWFMGLSSPDKKYRPYGQFIAEADGILQLDPKDHLTLYRRGLTYGLKAEDDPQANARKALADFRAAIALKKDEPEYWGRYLAFLQFLRSKEMATDEEIIEVFKAASAANPNAPDFYVGLGNFLYRILGAGEKIQERKEKYRADAMELFKKAIEKAPGSAAGYLGYAEMLINEAAATEVEEQKKQAYEKAMTVLAQARKNTEELHRVSNAQAVVYEQQGQYAKGIEAYRQAILEVERRSAATTRPATSQPTSRPIRRETAAAMLSELYYRLGHALLNEAGRREEKDRQGYVDEAKTSLKQIRAIAPNDATGVNLEARLLILDKKYNEALRLLDATFEQNKHVLTFHNLLLLADLCLSRNMPSKAETIMKDLRDPGDTGLMVKLLVLKARCRQMLNDPVGAGTKLDEALKLDPKDELALKLRAQLDTTKERQDVMRKWTVGQRDEAIRDMEKIYQRRPQDVQVIGELARMLDMAGRRPGLLAIMEEAAKRLPNDEDVKLMQQIFNETDMNKRREIYLRSFQKIQDPFARNAKLAEHYMLTNQPDVALRHLQQAHAANPKEAAVVYQLFILELQRKNPDEARKWAQTLLKLDETNGQLALGELAMNLHDAGGAIQAFTKVLKVNKDIKQILVFRGSCYLEKGQIKEAEQDFKAAWEADNRYLDAAAGLARVGFARKDLEMAKRWISQAAELPEGIRNKWVREQWLVFRERSVPAEPVQNLLSIRQRILAADPEDVDNRLRLADLYVRAKEFKKAEDEYKNVFEKSKEGMVRAAKALADLYLHSRQPDKARSILNEVQTKAQDRVGAMLVYGDFLLQTDGPTNQVKRVIDEAIKLNAKDARCWLELGKYHVIAAQWDKAVEATEKALQVGVNDIPYVSEADVRRSLIECTIRAGKFDRARKAIDEILAQTKNDPTGLLLLDVLYEEQGEIEKAKAVLDQGLKDNPNSLELQRARGLLRARLGEFQEAQQDLQKARDMDPSDVRVVMGLARLYERLRLYQNARVEYSQVISQNPGYRAAYERLMYLYLRDQDWGKFTRVLEDARASFPDDPGLLMREGEMWLQRNEPGQALAKMKQAVESGGGTELAIFGTYLATLAEMGQHQAVLSATEKRASEANPPGWVLAARGQALAKLEKPAEADKAFEKALQVSNPGERLYLMRCVRAAYGDEKAVEKAIAWGQGGPGNWEWDQEIGRALSEQALKAKKGAERDQRIRRAVEHLTKARDGASDARPKAEIEFIIGTLYQLAEMPKEAEQAYQRALKIVPRNLQTLNNLAVLYAEDLNQPQKAVECAEQVIKYFEVDANALDTWGWALARAGDCEKAVGVLTRAKVQDPDMVDIRYHLGWALEKLKRTAEANAEYKRGLEITQGQKDNRLYQALEAGLKRTGAGK